MNSDVERKIQRAKNNLDETMRIISEIEELEKDEFVTNCEAVIEQIFELEEKYKNHQSGLTKANNSTTLNDYEKIYKAETDAKRLNVKQSDGYKKFMGNITDYLNAAQLGGAIGVTNTVVDGDVEMEEEIQKIDPLTKRPLTNPVRNKICGHVYEKTSVHEAVAMNQCMRCPAMGCGNKQYVQIAHLEEDRALMMKLRALKKQHESNSSDED